MGINLYNSYSPWSTIRRTYTQASFQRGPLRRPRDLSRGPTVAYKSSAKVRGIKSPLGRSEANSPRIRDVSISLAASSHDTP